MNIDKKLDEVQIKFDNLIFEINKLNKEYIKSMEGVNKLYPIKRESSIESFKFHLSNLQDSNEYLLIKGRFLKTNFQTLGIIKDFLSIEEVTDDLKDFKKSLSSFPKKASWLKNTIKKLYEEEIVGNEVFKVLEDIYQRYFFRFEYLKETMDRVYDLFRSIEVPEEKGLYGKRFKESKKIHNTKISVDVIPRFNTEKDQIMTSDIGAVSIRTAIDTIIEEELSRSDLDMFKQAKGHSNTEIGTKVAKTLGSAILQIFNRNPNLIRASKINVRLVISPQQVMEKEELAIGGQCHMSSNSENIILHMPFDIPLIWVFIAGVFAFRLDVGRKLYAILIHEITHALDSAVIKGSERVNFLEEMGFPNPNKDLRDLAIFFAKIRTEGFAEVQSLVLKDFQHKKVTDSISSFYLVKLKSFALSSKPKLILNALSKVKDIDQIWMHKKSDRVGNLEYLIGKYMFLIIFLEKLRRKALFYLIPEGERISTLVTRKVGIEKFAEENGWKKLKKKDLKDQMSLRNENFDRTLVFVDAKYQDKINEIMVLFNLMDVPRMFKAYKKACKSLGIKQEFFRRNQFEIKDKQIKKFLDQLL